MSVRKRTRQCDSCRASIEPTIAAHVREPVAASLVPRSGDSIAVIPWCLPCTRCSIQTETCARCQNVLLGLLAGRPPRVLYVRAGGHRRSRVCFTLICACDVLCRLAVR